MHTSEPALTEHDGIRILSAEIAVPFTGTLVFGVGSRDATARTAGLAHLVEHLVMRGVGRVSMPHNASTSADAVSFFATGAPDKVAEFLARVARSISRIADISEADLEAEKAAVAAELGEDAENTGVGPLLVRFGAAGPGLLDLGQPALFSFTREMVVEFVEQWLVAPNAAITFTGDVPDLSGVALPVGETPRRSAEPPRIRTKTPILASTGPFPVTVSVVMEGTTASLVAVNRLIETQFMDVLRKERSLVYSVDSFGLQLDDTHYHLAFGFDCAETEIENTAIAAVSTLRELGTGGPSDELLAHIVESGSSELALPGAAAPWLDTMAVDIVRGDEPTAFADYQAALDGLTRESVIAVIAESLDSLIVTANSSEISPATLETLEMEQARALDPLYPGMTKREQLKDVMRDEVELLSPRWRRGLSGSLLHVEPTAIGLDFGEDAVRIAVDDLALVGIMPDGSYDLTSTSGGGFVVDPKDWRGAKHIEKFMASVDPAIVFNRRT